MIWDYIQPVTIQFGGGRVAELTKVAAELGGSKGILVSDPFFKTGLAQKIIEDSQGMLTCGYYDVSPNPDVSEVDACAQVMRDNGVDFVISLGGGSAIDLAKAAASICLRDESIRAYHGTGVAMPQEHLPMIAIPTTSGTGTEVTCVSVLTDHALGKKSPIVSNAFYPAVAIIDPQLTHTMPPRITASTGIDVLSHALEGYWSKGHQPICDALAIHASQLVFKYLERAYADGNDAEAREAMSEASVIAGLAFTLPKTTSSHACSFPLTNIHKIAHGEACGLTLHHFAKINAQGVGGERVDAFARAMGFADGMALADEIFALKERLGLLNDLKHLNLTEEQIADLVRISRHPNLYNNPVDITDEMLEEMYRGMA